MQDIHRLQQVQDALGFRKCGECKERETLIGSGLGLRMVEIGVDEIGDNLWMDASFILYFNGQCRTYGDHGSGFGQWFANKGGDLASSGQSWEGEGSAMLSDNIWNMPGLGEFHGYISCGESHMGMDKVKIGKGPQLGKQVIDIPFEDVVCPCDMLQGVFL